MDKISAFFQEPSAWLTMASVVIALIALFQTYYQTKLGNKHQLFDRRVKIYLLFTTLLQLYKEQSSVLGLQRKISYRGSELFVWLTNCSNLEDMAEAIGKPLHSEEHKNLLVKCERLRNASVEASMIFDSEVGKITSDFIKTYSYFLKALYQQQLYLARREKDEQGEPPRVEDYIKDSHKMAEDLNLYKMNDRLDGLVKEIDDKKIVKKLKREISLLRQ